jgi:hypothetical protein
VPRKHAKETDNCSQDAHAVLDIFVVYHFQQSMSVKCEERMMKTKKVNDCDIWHFFGDSRSKGKKNNHVFHNGCLDYILNHYILTLKDKNINSLD